MRGYVYALINPALQGLVKVGRTDRNPEGRAQELSAHTGVPTPFFVAYQRSVNDSAHAESWVHTVLERKGYRLSDRREFFTAPLHEVIEVLHSYPDTMTVNNIAEQATDILPETGDEFLDSLSVKDAPIWQEIFDEAENFHYGYDDQLEDPVEAIRLYKQAANLGCATAYRRIGEIYEYGNGISRSVEQALAYYKKAIALGDFVSYAFMANLFSSEEHSTNEAKCWMRFYEALEIRLDSGEDPDNQALMCIVSSLVRAFDYGHSIFGENVIIRLGPQLLEKAHSYRSYKVKARSRTDGVDKAIRWLESHC